MERGCMDGMFRMRSQRWILVCVAGSREKKVPKKIVAEKFELVKVRAWDYADDVGHSRSGQRECRWQGKRSTRRSVSFD
jgi:hypothetical protein